MEITSYIQAAFPAVCVETVEEQRFIDELRTSIASASDTYHIYQIDARSHLYEWRNSMPIATDGRCDYGKAFELVADKQFAILIALDWQHICHNANAYRKLKSQFDKLKANGSCIILISPSWKLPDELTHDIPVVDYALPDRQQLQQQLNLVVKSASTELDDDNHAQECLNAAAGLTLAEADNTFALSFVKSRRINPKIIEQEKMNLVRSSGYLEVWPAEPIENVGGLDTLKDYFTQEVIPAKDDAELQVKGILLMGPPGVGKSLAAKAAASLLSRPLLRLDIGSLKGSLVGQSEHNIKAALRLVDAIAPAILFVDEIEKSIAGYQSSGHTDSGVTAGMLGTLLTWLQEHTTPVFTIATCNNYAALPPELTRAGRFDERFFVDLPTTTEREAIALIHLKRFKCNESFAGPIAKRSEGWTGAEIEQLVKSSARISQRDIDIDTLTSCAANIKPISKVRADEIDSLRKWATDTLRIANTPEVISSNTARRIRM